ncbi:MAG TPA: class I SAM-dependent methyltransferase [Dehalococcoidales bacterium]|nr:class I SAM-dependent methyltransferase [Dehalococcoidales bacterium]
MISRIPLTQEPIAEAEAVAQYDKGARLYMLPEYKYFAWKLGRLGIKAGRVLDIGTGSGRLAIELAKWKGNNFQITGLDISENMLKKAQENIENAGVENKIKLVSGNADSLPYPDGYFDLVVSYASLHHWFRPAKVFREAQRVVKRGGAVIIRDNRRVYGNRFWEAFIRVLSLFMNRRHSENWPKAIMASYTIPEIKTILQEAGLNYRVRTDFIKFDMCVDNL